MRIDWEPRVSIADIVKVLVMVVATAGFVITMQTSIATNTETLRQLKEITVDHEGRLNDIEHWRDKKDAYEQGIKDGQK